MNGTLVRIILTAAGFAGLALTAVPARAETPRPACAADRDARVVAAAIPEMPAILGSQGVAGDVGVQVDLNEDGRLIGAYVAKSSGNPILDEEALRAARNTRFTSETVACRPISGSYLFDVDFNLN